MDSFRMALYLGQIAYLIGMRHMPGSMVQSIKGIPLTIGYRVVTDSDGPRDLVECQRSSVERVALQHTEQVS